MLSEITITCFSASYAVSLGLEFSRLFFRAPVRLAVMIAFGAAGLFAHAVYLYNLAQSELNTAVSPLSSWYDWCLLAAWPLAACYLYLVIKRPQTSFGLFLLPMVLALIGLAYFAQGLAPFPRGQALGVWGGVHGLTLLLGTVTAAMGFAAGVMYLVQSYRLKHKLLPRRGFRLPSLELLQKTNMHSLFFSWLFIMLGLAAGVALNLVKHAQIGGETPQGVPWSDSAVVISAVLFLWLLAVAVFEFVYKPARQGRKVAYLTIFSFVLLSLALSIVLFGSTEHAKPSTTLSKPVWQNHQHRGIL